MRLSFRDPDGFVFRSGNRILRCVFPGSLDGINGFLSSELAAQWMSLGMLCATSAAGVGWETAGRIDVPPGAAIFEHRPLPFPNYPYEWPPAMLHSAAVLTLRMCREALECGFGLKDATPYNIMFDGPAPVFIDVLSFERRDPLDPIWRSNAQFIRTFIYPLLAVRHFGLRLDELLTVHRDGLEPERMLHLCSPWRLLVPPFFGCVTLPAILARRGGTAPERFSPRRARDAGEARFLMGRVLDRAGRLLGRAKVREPNGAHVRYMESGHQYTPGQIAAKECFVAGAFDRLRPAKVLDLGCNTGHFSLLAARHGASVVAVDRAPEAVDVLWRRATAGGAGVLPLVVDIARPPGAYGWENCEAPSFLDRARGRFDCVLMLALIHHLLVSERVPLGRILDLAAQLTTRWLVVEYVDPADSQFRRIARGRDILHRDLTPRSFEEEAGRRFETVDSAEVTPTRRIYIFRKRDV